MSNSNVHVSPKGHKFTIHSDEKGNPCITFNPVSKDSAEVADQIMDMMFPGLEEELFGKK